MKTILPAHGTWMWYADNVSNALGRNLTEKEVKIVMQGYINNKDWNKIVEQLS